MTIDIKKATTDVTVYVKVIDDTDGTPEAPTFETAGIDLWYMREGADHVAITEITQTAAGAHDDGGFVHISDGICRLDLPDAACLTGVDHVYVGGTFTGMIVIEASINLVDYDPFDAVRLGLTALPNAAANAAGGLPISAAGALALDTQLANTNEVTAARMGALTDWINGGRLDLLLDAIPTTAMRGTDSAATETKQDAQDAIITEARLAELDAGNLPTDIAAIPTTAMRGTDNAATETKQDAQDAIITEARLAELDAGNLPTDIAAIPTTMVGTDNAATEAKQDAQDAIITEARLAELDAANLPADIDGITATVDAADESIPRNDTFNFSFRMVDATDGFTLEPGLTVTGTCSIDGAAFTNITGTIAETAAASGVYRITGAAADSNGVEVVFKFASAGARTKLIFARTRVVV